MTDPYSVLGLPPNASDEDVKKAYKRLAKKYHPDVAGNSEEAQRKMQEINAAYDAIINHKESFSSGYGYQNSYNTNYESEEPIELRAAVAYINARRYMEALNTLRSISRDERYQCGDIKGTGEHHISGVPRQADRKKNSIRGLFQIIREYQHRILPMLFPVLSMLLYYLIDSDNGLTIIPIALVSISGASSRVIGILSERIS